MDLLVYLSDLGYHGLFPSKLASSPLTAVTYDDCPMDSFGRRQVSVLFVGVVKHVVNTEYVDCHQEIDDVDLLEGKETPHGASETHRSCRIVNDLALLDWKKKSMGLIDNIFPQNRLLY